jgi:hypothetical protein
MPPQPSVALLSAGSSLVALLLVCAVAVRTFERGQPLFDA